MALNVKTALSVLALSLCYPVNVEVPRLIRRPRGERRGKGLWTEVARRGTFCWHPTSVRKVPEQRTENNIKPVRQLFSIFPFIKSKCSTIVYISLRSILFINMLQS